MAIIGWTVLGLIAGYIASAVWSKDGEGLPMYIGVGIFGAVMGGWIFTALGPSGVTGFNLLSTLVVILGAVVLLVIWRVVRPPVSSV